MSETPQIPDSDRRTFMGQLAVLGLSGSLQPDTILPATTGIDKKAKALLGIRTARIDMTNILIEGAKLVPETVARLSSYTVRELRRLYIGPFALPKTPQQAAEWHAIREILHKRKYVPSGTGKIWDAHWEQARNCEKIAEKSTIHQENPILEHERVASLIAMPHERVAGLLRGLIEQKEKEARQSAPC